MPENEFKDPLQKASWKMWEALVGEFRSLAGMGEEAAAEFDAIKPAFFAFWARKALDDPEADRELEIVRQRAALIASRAAMRGAAAAETTIAKALEIAAQLGAGLLKALIVR